MKRNFHKRISWLLVLMLLCGLLPARAEAYTVTSEVIIEPQYEEADVFYDGYAPVKKDGLWGFVDETGKEVVTPQFAWVSDCNDGYAVAAKYETVTGGYNYETDSEDPFDAYVIHLIDMQGKDIVLMDPYPDFITGNTVPLYYVTMENMANRFNHTWRYANGVVLAGRYPYTTDGEPIIPKNTEVLTSLSGGFDWFFQPAPASADGIIPMIASYLYQDNDYQCFYMDLEGNIVKTFAPGDTGSDVPGIENLYAPQQGLILARSEVLGQDGSVSYAWGIMDMENNWVVEPTLRTFWTESHTGEFFFDGLMGVQDMDTQKFSVINPQGDTVIPPEYDNIIIYNHGYVPAMKDGHYIYLDTQGNPYQIAGLDGGVANITLATCFSDFGIAAVYDAENNVGYCISSDSMNGILPKIHGSEELAYEAYFNDYDNDGKIDAIEDLDEIITIVRDGKWGFAKLDLGYANPFTDIQDATQFYYEPVLWAVDKGITTGMTEDTFVPGSDCTRGQIVTFLWRAKGQPEPASLENPFTDVAETDFFYKAVLWAYHAGITTGMTETTFAPGVSCTRAQAVTFLWRQMGEPAPDTAADSFTDTEDGQFYAKAVCWALDETITNGMDATTFGTDVTCSRGHIVTFLYRTYTE